MNSSLDYDSIIRLFKDKKDLDYLEFNKRIVGTNYEMIGVRTNDIRVVSKQIKNSNIYSFLDNKKDNYYEDILLEAFVIGYIKDNNEFLKYFNNYIKKIDCWALCDMAASSFKIIGKNKDLYFDKIKLLIQSKYQYSVRMGIVLLLDYYIEDKYIKDIFKIVDSVKREEYYINMAIAWLLSICYIKFKKETDEYLKVCNLDKFTYNKTISKICDSYRVDKKDKEDLKRRRITKK